MSTLNYVHYNVDEQKIVQPIIEPTSDLEVANKAYVDARVDTIFDQTLNTTDDVQFNSVKSDTTISADTFQGCTTADTFNMGNLTLTGETLTSPTAITVGQAAQDFNLPGTVVVEDLEALNANHLLPVNTSNLVLRDDQSTDNNTAISAQSWGSSILYLESDRNSAETQTDYNIFGSNESQSGVILNNFYTGAGLQIYTDSEIPASGNTNTCYFQAFRQNGTTPVCSMSFRLGDEHTGKIGWTPVNVDNTTGTEILNLSTTNTDVNNILRVDAIDENTNTSGVTIEGLLVRDSVLDLGPGFPNFFKVGGVAYGGDQSFFTTSPMNFQSVRLSNEVFTDTIEENTLDAGITFNHEIYLPTSGTTADALDFYANTTVSIDFTGGTGFVSGSLNAKLLRIGNLCSLSIPDFTGTQSTTSTLLSTAGFIPTYMRPTTILKYHQSGYNSVSLESIEILILPAGTLEIGLADNGNTVKTLNMTDIGISSINLTWVL